MNNINEHNHKDNLFQLIFGEYRENALSLYNAVNGTSYTNADDLIFQKVESGVFTKMEHDVGFIFDRSLNLYEHQSTMNPNMPLRGLFYFADMYRESIPAHSRLYGSNLVKIDNPKFVVFYNGEARTDSDVVKMKLSDAFAEKDSSGEYEWTATMININAGHSRKLMKACRILEEYSILIGKIREYRCTMELHDAIIKAVDECIEAGVLADVLMKYRKEIVMKIINDFTEEEFHEMLREEAFEEGVKRGMAQGMERGMAQGMERGMSQGMERGIVQGMEQGMERGIEQTIAVISMLKENASDETIMNKLGCSIQVIEQIRQEVLV